MARWLSARRREAAEGTLEPAYSHRLAQVPGWAENRREIADEARWHDRLAELVDFRQEGDDWPRNHDYDSKREQPSESGSTPSGTNAAAATLTQ